MTFKIDKFWGKSVKYVRQSTRKTRTNSKRLKNELRKLYKRKKKTHAHIYIFPVTSYLQNSKQNTTLCRRVKRSSKMIVNQREEQGEEEKPEGKKDRIGRITEKKKK